MTNKVKVAMLVVISFLVPVVPFVVIGELPGGDWLAAQDDNLLLYAFIGIAILATDTLLPIPSSVVGTLISATLGPVWGCLVIWFGLTAGNVVGYLIGMLWPSKVKPDMPESPALFVLFLSRPIPVLAEAMTVVAGANRVDFIRFVLSAGAGNFIYSIALGLNGAVVSSSSELGLAVSVSVILPIFLWWAWKKTREGFYSDVR